MTTSRRTGRRGRKPAKVDVKAKLERSRQSARECRARKKLRYQYLEELVTSREKAIYALRKELETCKQWCMSLDKGKLPADIREMLEMERKRGLFTDEEAAIPRTKDWCELTLDNSDDDYQDHDKGVEQETEEISSRIQNLSDTSRKGKGKGKASLKSATNVQNVNMDNSRLEDDQLVVSQTDNASPLGKVSQLPPDIQATASPFAIDTPALDTTSRVQSVNMEQAKYTPVSPGIKFPTINPLDLLPEASNALDVNPAIIGALSQDDQVTLGTLSEADINDVLEVIEKDVGV